MNRRVLITGTSSGIGEACAERFHRAGWQVLATVRRDADAERLQQRFPGIRVLVVDLQDSDAVDAVIGAALERAGGVDALVNNAGASIIAAAEELSLADFRAQMDLNLFAAIRLTQHVLPAMRARRCGRIIQVSSGFGRIALPMFSAYCASKFALEGFSEALAHEVLPFGIGVALVEPGTVRTRFDTNRREGERYDPSGAYAGLYEVMRERLAASHARGPSTPAEVAGVVFHAATAARPRLRYTVGRLGWLAAAAARVVPDSLKLSAVARMVRR